MAKSKDERIDTCKVVIEQTHEITVQTIQVPNMVDRYLYRYREMIRRVGTRGRSVNHQGITNLKGVETLKKGEFVGGDYRSDISYMVLIDKGRDAVDKMGYSALDSNLGSDRVFDHVEKGGSFDDIIGSKSYDHTFWDIWGNEYPVGIYFDYIGAQFDNINYRLEQAVEILRERSDVLILGEDGFDPAPRGKEIRAIPYYNAENGRTHYMSFFWRPSREQLALIRKSSKLKMEEFKAIFDHDMLGLRAGGAAKYDDYYGAWKDNA